MMGLVVPHPATELDLRSAGLNGNGEFVVSGKGSQVVRVPDEWRVPLASHLLAPTRMFDPKVTRLLREIQGRVGKGKRKGAVSEEEAKQVSALADALEALMEHYLDGDPKTSRRIEWHPELYAQREKAYRAARGGDPDDPPLPLQQEEMDDTPLPWEK